MNIIALVERVSDTYLEHKPSSDDPALGRDGSDAVPGEIDVRGESDENAGDSVPHRDETSAGPRDGSEVTVGQFRVEQAGKPVSPQRPPALSISRAIQHTARACRPQRRSAR